MQWEYKVKKKKRERDVLYIADNIAAAAAATAACFMTGFIKNQGLTSHQKITFWLTH